MRRNRSRGGRRGNTGQNIFMELGLVIIAAALLYNYVADLADVLPGFEPQGDTTSYGNLDDPYADFENPEMWDDGSLEVMRNDAQGTVTKWKVRKVIQEETRTYREPNYEGFSRR